MDKRVPKEGPYMLKVVPEEAGQKLLQCLQRRLCLPAPLLHRWIRTGQIRLNGCRTKPFDRVIENDDIRLPPFVLAMLASTEAGRANPVPDPSVEIRSLPPLVHADADMLVFNKPAGLPAHSGTGHETDSLATRLAVHYAGAAFLPTLAHRLDKDTSGLLLAGRSYVGLRALQDALRDGALIKEYLAWVEGRWPHDGQRLLRHNLAKRHEGVFERMRTGQGKEAVCTARCLRAERGRSLMHIRLHTGRTHQIRAQLAAEGHPLCGDVKYGGRAGQPLRLHALRLLLPDGREFTAPPPWSGDDALDAALPPPLPVSTGV